MKNAHIRVGDIIRLERRPVEVDPLETYAEIGVRSFGKGIFHKEPISGADLGNKRVFRVEPGDLVLSNVFAWEGAIAVATDAERGRIGSHRFMTYVPVDARVVTQYLRYFFLSECGLRLIRTASPGSAGRNRTLAVDRFRDVVLPLPEIGEQRHIVRRLERLDSQLDRVMHLDQAASRLSGALLSSLLQTDAKRRPVGDVVRPLRREEPVDPSREYCLLGVRWYGEGLFVRERKPGSEVAATKLYRIEEGDFVYNRLFAWKGSFAVAGPDMHDCHVSGEFPAFEVDRGQIDVHYLLALFSDPAAWAVVENRSVGGTPTSRNRLKEQALLKLEIPVPPLDEQVRLVKLVRRIGSTRELRQRRAVYVDGFRGSVLNRAFAGLM